jgi:hypothetical protein
MSVKVLYRPPVSDPDTAAIAERIRLDIREMSRSKEERFTYAHDALTYAALRAASVPASDPDYGQDNWGRSLPRPQPVIASSKGWYK